MSSFSDAFKSVVSTVAPLLGTALGGPLGGLAGTMISKAFGTTNADGTTSPMDPKKLEALVLGQDPDTMVKLKQIEDDFQVQMKNLDITEEKLSYDDRASARQREATVKDWVPGLLAFGVTGGFFGVLVYMMTHHIPTEDRDTLNIMLGSLGTAWISIIAYYFGSSMGSRAKDDTISNLSK